MASLFRFRSGESGGKKDYWVQKRWWGSWRSHPYEKEERRERGGREGRSTLRFKESFELKLTFLLFLFLLDCCLAQISEWMLHEVKI